MTHIDHIFIFPRNLGELQRRLQNAGLEPSFQREHPGQGTANVCYCFDNLYLELLWVTDAAARLNPQVARTALIERGTGTTSACPVGIAWRDGPGRPLELETWNYTAPFLPAGFSIAVAFESTDPQAPFIFRSPGTSPPTDWRDGRQGNMQRAAGITTVEEVVLEYPVDRRPGSALTEMTKHTILTLEPGRRWSFSLWLERRDHAGPLLLDDIC
ncbi:VOC family protein [Sagittula sp. NFXS13]|uniref:VOC family protein n=1 Tax=Sagittula sp. NFXS13 TaxID=2819095 RepID=UPI0032DFE649